MVRSTLLKEDKKGAYMNLEGIKDILCEWGSKDPDIRTVYIYGSRARGDFGKNSDLDIAIEFDRKQGHIDGYSIWISHSEEYKRQVESLLPETKVHLEYYDRDKTPTVKRAIDQSCVLVYSREKEQKSKG